MSLRLWSLSIFIITILIDFSYEKHLGFYFSDFKFKFDPKHMNLSIDMSIYKRNSKKHPVYLVPEAKIQIFQDIPRLHIQLYAKDLKTEKTLANRTLDFCDMEEIVHHNVFLHSLLAHFLENLKFAIKCPFKKGVYIMKEHKMPNYAVPGLMKAKDKYINVQKIKSRLEKHIITIFESSYQTEVVEFD